MDAKDSLSLLIIFLVNPEVPVIGQKDLEPGVVRSLYLDDIRGEIGSEANVKGLDNPRYLGLSSRKDVDSEGLVRIKHHKIRPEDNSSGFFLVVKDLDCAVKGALVSNGLGFIVSVVQQVLDIVTQLILV